jgi:spore maturation protein CgeB
VKILIQNPTPDDVEDQPFWGDFHFGAAFSHYLQVLGHEVETQYWLGWKATNADVLLVLRGLRETKSIEGDFNKKIIWLISHPEDVSDEELQNFDIVLCGSVVHVEQLKKRGFTAYPFLQCTDHRTFYPQPRKTSEFQNAFVFVGNWRGNNRSLVGRAMHAQLPLKIWGRVWTRPAHQKFIVDDYLPNERLGDLYRSSFATLNNHWADMVSFNYVNNRFFDALACGLPLVTEPHAGMDTLQLEGIRIIHEEDSFDDAIDEFIVNYKRYQEAAFEDSALILKEHTFEARAQQFDSILK